METRKRRRHGPRRADQLKQRAEYPNSIRYLRLEAGMTLAEVAAHLDVTPQAIHKAELGLCSLDRYKWYRLADLFHCDPRALETPRLFFAANIQYHLTDITI